MDFISTGTEILKQENVLTPRQKDIIDTEKEVLKFPFDRNTAIGQVEKNCIRYPKLALGAIMPIAIRGCSLEQVIFANHYMISKGKGLIVIPEKDVPEFKKLLVAYYENRDNGEIHTFMRQQCWRTF